MTWGELFKLRGENAQTVLADQSPELRLSLGLRGPVVGRDQRAFPGGQGFHIQAGNLSGAKAEEDKASLLVMAITLRNFLRQAGGMAGVAVNLRPQWLLLSEAVKRGLKEATAAAAPRLNRFHVVHSFIPCLHFRSFLKAGRV